MKRKIEGILEMVYSLATQFDYDMNELKADGYLVVLGKMDFDPKKTREKILDEFARMPKPAEIKALILGEHGELSRNKASAVLAAVGGLVRDFGYTNPAGAKKAASEDVRYILSRLGKWSEVCKIDFRNTSATAQIRDNIEHWLLEAKNNPEIKQGFLLSARKPGPEPPGLYPSTPPTEEQKQMVRKLLGPTWGKGE